MVFLQAAARPGGPAAACMALVEGGLVELVVSEEIVEELTDVLSRPELRWKFPALTRTIPREFVDAVVSRATMMRTPPRAFALPRDPKDEPYINLAIDARATHLVTRDADLLSLADPAHPDHTRLIELAPQLSLVDPVRFLRDVRESGK